MLGRSRHRLPARVAIAGVVILGVLAAQAQLPTVRGPAAPGPSKPAGSLAADAAAAEPAPSDEQPKRLILKDGSYQPTIRWEDRGDRIRYLSAERYQWEEIPKELIDWDATQQYHLKLNPPEPTPEMRRAMEAEAAAAAAAAEEEERRAQAELDLTNPEVAPGLRLPDGGGVYLLDTYRGGPQLVELIQNGSTINKDTGRNLLRAAINPLAKNKQKIELEGRRARIQAHVPDPVIYLNIDDLKFDEGQDSPAEAAATPLAERFHIVRVKTEKRKRVVGTLEFAFYSGAAEKTALVPTEVTRLGEQWIKVRPSEKLTPGEYALVEMLGKNVNLYVWDFGVDPIAPENPAKWTPQPEEQKEKGRSVFRQILGIPDDPDQ